MAALSGFKCPEHQLQDMKVYPFLNMQRKEQRKCNMKVRSTGVPGVCVHWPGGWDNNQVGPFSQCPIVCFTTKWVVEKGTLVDQCAVWEKEWGLKVVMVSRVLDTHTHTHTHTHRHAHTLAHNHSHSLGKPHCKTRCSFQSHTHSLTASYLHTYTYTHTHTHTHTGGVDATTHGTTTYTESLSVKALRSFCCCDASYRAELQFLT